MGNDINQNELKEFYDKGVLAFEKKNYEYAIEIFSQIVSSKYDHLEARHYLHLSLKNKHSKESASFISKISNTITRLLGTLSAEGLLKKGKYQEALEQLEKILSSNPNDNYALKKIADIFYDKNLVLHAIQNLEEAKSIAVNDVPILKKLGDIYIKKEDYKNAKLNYEQALKISPNDREVSRSLKNLDALGVIQKDFGA